MDIGSILILLALLILVGLYVARPLFERKSNQISQEEHEYSALLAERDRTLTALQELDFDYTLGKIPEEDYPAQRARMLAYGVEVLRSLDAHARQPGTAERAEDRLERAIAERRAQRVTVASAAPIAEPAGSPPSGGDDQLEAKIAERRRMRNGKAAGFCPKCGSPLQKSDRFCPRCGAPS
jgi:hypothetical protein